MPRWSRAALLPLLIGPGDGCGCRDQEPTFDVVIRVRGEDGEALGGAIVDLGSEPYATATDGRVSLVGLDRPVLAVVSAAGHLDEPVTLGWEDDGRTVDVELLARRSGRLVLHFGGDLMLGRRYTDPDEGPALVTPGDGGASAREVVSDLAPAFSLADLATVNLESVVGTWPEADAYPAKRWLLQTHPDALAALDELGVDVAVLGNNHQRDWMDAGVAGTLDELDAAGLERVGAGIDAEEAAAPLVLAVDDVSVGLLSFTSVDGDDVNGWYPGDDEAAPDPIPEEDAWLWEQRTWGYEAAGIAVDARRIGEAWRLIAAAEPDLDEEAQAALWADAAGTYPELQDWVARRGHGGGNPWGDDAVEVIGALAAVTDLTVVQLHMGYQYALAPGAAVRAAAYAAVEAGADLVVVHHPHVLQGVELVGDGLVAWSLGNLAMDQDFLTTFRSVLLRVVWDARGAGLVQARLVPLFADRYRPVPTTGALARDTLRGLWEASLAGTTAEARDDGSVVAVLDSLPDDASAPRFAWDRHTALLEAGAAPVGRLTVELPAGETVALGHDGLVRRPLGSPPPEGVLVGRAAFGLGGFEDEDTDLDVGELTAWSARSEDVAAVADEALVGVRSLRLVRDQHNAESVSARFLARVPLVEHRTWEATGGDPAPLDGPATWSVRIRARLDGEAGLARLRLRFYRFEDLDPTEDPASTDLGEWEVPLDLEPGQERALVVDLPTDAFDAAEGGGPNAVLVKVTLDPPESRVTRLYVDEVELVEWREAALEPDLWAALDYLRDTTGRDRTLSVDVLDW